MGFALIFLIFIIIKYRKKCAKAIFNLFFRGIFLYFYYQIFKGPILNYTLDSFEVLNILNIILFLIIFIIFTYVGNKLYDFCLKAISNVVGWLTSDPHLPPHPSVGEDTANAVPFINKRGKTFHFLQANPGPFLGLMGFFQPTNSSMSSLFHATRAYEYKKERSTLQLVLSKLDMDQPLANGDSRLANFEGYLNELNKRRIYGEF